MALRDAEHENEIMPIDMYIPKVNVSEPFLEKLLLIFIVKNFTTLYSDTPPRTPFLKKKKKKKKKKHFVTLFLLSLHFYKRFGSHLECHLYKISNDHYTS